VVLKVGNIAPLGAIFKKRGAKTAKGAIWGAIIFRGGDRVKAF